LYNFQYPFSFPSKGESMTSSNNLITLSINRQNRQVDISPDENLRDVLRRLSYFSVKHGCEDGTCGICTVLMNGKAVRSCRVKAAEAVGKEVTTLEGIADKELHALQKAFLEAGASQCGICTPGQILTAKALLDANTIPARLRSARP
jgi:aerobic-type carbon monoxide dehydrogenase small subunit (CoxS/CutS family)